MEALEARTESCLIELAQFIASLQERFTAINALQSRFDREQEDILHYIEFCNLEPEDESKLFARLKEVRHERRKVKDEWEALQSVLDALQNAGLIHYEHKKRKYAYLVVSLETILGNRRQEDGEV